MRLVYRLDDQVAAWVVSRIPHVPSVDVLRPYAAFGIVDSTGTPAGGIIWHGWQPHFRGIELTAASDTAKWLSRRILAEVFSYPFLFLGCERVTTATPRSNVQALNVNKKIGFSFEGIVRRGFYPEDAILMGFLRGEWLDGRWGPREGDTTDKLLTACYRPMPEHIGNIAAMN